MSKEDKKNKKKDEDAKDTSSVKVSVEKDGENAGVLENLPDLEKDKDINGKILEESKKDQKFGKKNVDMPPPDESESIFDLDAVLFRDDGAKPLPAESDVFEKDDIGKKTDKKGDGKDKKQKKAKKFKKKVKRDVPRGHAHIKSSYNNTIVTITDPQGNVLAWSSAGHVGFKGPKKSTPYAAGVVVRNVAEKISDFKVKELDVFLCGVGQGREASMRALNSQGFKIISIKDVTPIAHNGCRPPKPRRV